MQESWVRSLGWEDALEKGEAPHSSILAWRIPWTVKSQTRLSDFHSLTHSLGKKPDHAPQPPLQPSGAQ